jgi:hypothetical protein
MRLRARRGASTALSLAILVLVIVFGVVGLLASHMAVSSAQAEALRAAEMAAQAGREKLVAYLWKNVTSSGNITMLTLENRGDIGLTIDRAMAIGQTGSVLAERDLGGSPISLGAGERRTMRLDSILPGYTIYENVKKNVKNILFKTLRGNVFGSVYAAPERFEARYGVTLTGGGTTITLTKTSGETFTMPGTITITTITSVTMMQGLPQWDADIYVVVALKPDEYKGREYMFFSSSEYKAPDWAILPDLAKSGRTVTLIPKYVGCRIYHYNTNVKKYLVGFWEGINNIYPRPVWAAGERVGISGGCNDYRFPTYADGTYICAAYSDTNVCWKERFYARVTIPAGDVTIKAPSEIVFSEYMTKYQDNPHKLDTSHYYKTFFKLQYYIFYDALNMSNVLLSGNSAQATLRVDRPIKGAFVYVYSKTEVKLPPPPPPPPSVSVWLPNICWSDDPELTVASIKGDEKTRTVTVDFGSCSTCDAYVVPGPGTYDVSQVTKCSKSGNTASCKVPEGYTVILDGNPSK